MLNVNHYLEDMTGDDAVYWMNRIGQLIHKHSNHETRQTEVEVWVKELVDELTPRVLERARGGMDPNILSTRVLSLIFVLWTARIARAKCYDSRRERGDRRAGLHGLTEYGQLLTACLMDESMDGRLFPAQEWSSPFLPEGVKDVQQLSEGEVRGGPGNHTGRGRRSPRKPNG